MTTAVFLICKRFVGIVSKFWSPKNRPALYIRGVRRFLPWGRGEYKIKFQSRARNVLLIQIYVNKQEMKIYVASYTNVNLGGDKEKKADKISEWKWSG